MSTTTSTSARKARASTGRRTSAAGEVPSAAGTGSGSSDRGGQVKAAVTQLLRDAPAAEVDRVLTATSGGAGQALDAALWGPAPSREQAAAGVLANLRKQFAGRQALEGESVSRAEAAELLGTSEQAVTDGLEARRLLGFKRGRRWLIPAWQFDPEAERGVLPGLAELAGVFPGGVVALSGWATRSSADLADRTPRDVLADGGTQAVLQLARTVTSAGW